MDKKLVILRTRTAIKAILPYLMIIFWVTGFAGEALSQQYPTKPINLVIGWAPGGITDLSSRTIAKSAEKFLGQQILPLNKPGATQTVGVSYVMTSPPDGYTLGGSTDAPFVRAPHMLTLNFNPLTEVTPIVCYAYCYDYFIVRADSPFKNFKDVIDFARENPGKLTYGTAGIGTTPYILMEMLARQMNLKISHVAFKSEGEFILSLLGGHIMSAGTGSFFSFISQLKAGKIKILGTFEGENRQKELPQVPTLYEFGFKNPISVSAYLLIYGPKNLPGPIIEKVEDAFIKARDLAEFQNVVKEVGVFPTTTEEYITGPKLRNHIATTYENFKKILYETEIIKTKP